MKHLLTADDLKRVENDFDLGFVRRNVWYERPDLRPEQKKQSISPSIRNVPSNKLKVFSNLHFIGQVTPDRFSPIPRCMPREEHNKHSVIRKTFGSPDIHPVSPDPPTRTNHVTLTSYKVGSSVENQGVLILEGKMLTFVPLSRIPLSGIRV